MFLINSYRSSNLAEVDCTVRASWHIIPNTEPCKTPIQTSRKLENKDTPQKFLCVKNV